MANIKTYSIQINGIQESVKAVDALSASLDNLEKKIKSLEGKAVNIGSKVSGGDSKSSSTGALSEEAKLEKQIVQLEEKRIAHSKEIYQNYLAAKDVLKEIDNDQKSIAATERLQAKTYSNTIAGMKQELADIKSAMQNVDLSDTDQIEKMAQRANQLNETLKQIEESYGQFGRNVGNYASAFGKYKVEIGGVVREFDSAKQAAKKLSDELLNLPKGAKGAEELRSVIQQIKSEIQDLGKSSTIMDNLLDTMEGFMAVANAGQGLRALFGVNEAEMQRTIKNLLALQNALKGIETINKQINTREGVGKWIAPFTTGVDKATTKLLAFNTALLGTGNAAKVTAVGINAFGKALKFALSAGILIAIDLVIDGLMKLVDEFKKVDDATERTKEVQEAAGKAYAEATVKLSQYTSKVENFTGTKKEEKKIVEELNKELGGTLGTYKSLAEWKEVLKKKTDAYIQSMILEAKQQAVLNQLVAAYQVLWEKRRNMSSDLSYWEQVKDFVMGAGYSKKQRRGEIKEVSDMISDLEKQLETGAKEIAKIQEDYKIGDFAPQIEKNSKKSANAAKKAQEEITAIQLRAMDDGLNKQLMQLEEEKRQTINKIKENGDRVSEQVKKVEEAYAQIRLNTIQQYLDKLNNVVEESAKKIANVRFQIDTKDIELNINEIEEEIKKMTDDVVPINNTLTTKSEYGKHNQGLLAIATEFDSRRGKSQTEDEIKEYYKWLEAIVQSFSKDVQDKLKTQNVLTGEMELDYKAVEQYFEEHFKKELDIVRSYGYQENASLSSSFEFRLNALRAYDEDYIKEIDSALDAEMEEKQKAADLEKKQALANNKTQYDETVKSFRERKQEIEKGLAAIEKVTTDAGKEMTDKEKEKYDKLKENLETTNKQIEETQKQYADKVNQIAKEHGQKLTEIERQTTEKRQQNQQRYYDKQLSNYRDFLSKINSEAAKQPVTDKAGFGVVNVAATKKNYNEILSAATTTLENIKKDRDKLNEDFRNGLIKPENYNATLNQLNDLENETKQTSQTVADNLKNVNATFVQSLQMYLQASMEAYNKIMSAVWDAQDTAFDKEQEQIDKENEMLQDALEAQKDMISKYKSEIDSIEDELATSRGDRRQHLIDQLNAEMAAEREAHKQKQKIEQEQKRQQDKQDDLEKKRKKAQYKRDMLQAVVNGAMAVTMAAINSWPIPAIPMMALAGASTAAQIAIMAANKPYAKGGQLDGGVAQGPRHRDGGIPVLGGRASIEGGEFITNRLSTEKNIDLLEFINSKKKKVDVSDLIDFYSSGNVKKNISGIRTKFEDGGYVQPLPNIDVFDDDLRQSFERYSNRPIYVTVTDIENRMEQVKYVRTLAGVGQN